GRNNSRLNDGCAIGCEGRTVSLTGDLAGFERERTAAPFDFYFMGIEHILSSCGDAAQKRLKASPGWRTGHGQDNGKLAENQNELPAILPHDWSSREPFGSRASDPGAPCRRTGFQGPGIAPFKIKRATF